MEKNLAPADWPLWEVFIRTRQGLDHKHAGSLHAADAKMALENARDVYTRRNEGVSIWVVESRHIHASSPEEAGEFLTRPMIKYTVIPVSINFRKNLKTFDPPHLLYHTPGR